MRSWGSAPRPGRTVHHAPAVTDVARAGEGKRTDGAGEYGGTGGPARPADGPGAHRPDLRLLPGRQDQLRGGPPGRRPG